MSEREEMIGLREAAEFVGYGQSQLQTFCARKRIPHRQYDKGGRLRFLRSELERWMRGEWDVERGDWKAQEDK